MFPISHTYIASKVLGRRSDLLVLGSMLPDIRVISRDNSPLDNLHRQPKEFFDFLQDEFSDFYDLGLGVRLHCAQDKGADYYSDDREVGYALKEGRKILPDVGELINDYDKNGLVLAHNFIEAALDLKINNRDGIGKYYGEALETIDYKDIARVLAKYFQMSGVEVCDELIKFVSHFSVKNLSSPQGFATTFLPPMRKRYHVEDVDIQAVEKLIIKSEDLIDSSYEDYFTNTIDCMKQDWRYLV